jgi:hypothetical protein
MAMAMIAETATIHYRDGTSRVLARPKGSRRFFFLDDRGEPTESYRTRRTLDEWPRRDQRCERVDFEGVA